MLKPFIYFMINAFFLKGMGLTHFIDDMVKNIIWNMIKDLDPSI